VKATSFTDSRDYHGSISLSKHRIELLIL